MSATFVVRSGVWSGVWSVWPAAALTALVVAAVAAPLVRRVGVRTPARGASDQHRPAPDVVDLAERLAREVRAGRAVREAMVDALAAHPRLAPEVAHALDRHAPMGTALAAHRPRGDERDLLVHALSLGVEHVHVLPEVLDRTTVIIRERRAWRLERRAQSAQARTSARVLTVLPAVFAAWGVLSSPSVRHAYATSPVTLAVAIVGVVLNVAGWWWMRRVVGALR